MSEIPLKTIWNDWESKTHSSISWATLVHLGLFRYGTPHSRRVYSFLPLHDLPWIGRVIWTEFTPIQTHISFLTPLGCDCLKLPSYQRDFHKQCVRHACYKPVKTEFKSVATSAYETFPGVGNWFFVHLRSVLGWLSMGQPALPLSNSSQQQFRR